jgi:hypothetical protein
MNRIENRLVRAACGVSLLIGMTVSAQATNPLVTAPMPQCGPPDASFRRLLNGLKLQRAWRGAHENAAGELELAVDRNGAWFLFYHARDAQDRPRVCLIARGRQSRALFGNPV